MSVLLCVNSTMQAFKEKILPKDSIIQVMYTYASRHHLVIGRFESDVYLRFNMQTERKNPAMHLVPHMVKLEKGNHEYFGECFTHFNYLAPGFLDYKEIAFYSTHPQMRKIQDQVFSNLNIFIYEPCIMKDRILSPLNKRNRSYYHYKINDSLIYEQGHPFYKILITPRFHNTQLVKGHIYISALDGRVDRFYFKINYDMISLDLWGEMGKNGLESLLPTNIRMKARFVFIRNIVSTNFKISIKYNVLEPLVITNNSLWNRNGSDKYDLTYQNRLKLDTTDTQYGLHFFNKNRPHSLSYTDSLLIVHSQILQDTTSEDVKKKWISDSMEDVLLDSHYMKLSPKGKIRIPPLFTPSMFQWSKKKGLSLQTKFRINYENQKSHFLDATLRIGYNFKEKQFYWKLPVSYTFIPQYMGRFDFEIGNGNRIYSSVQADEVRHELNGIDNYDSLMTIFNKYDFNYYRDFYAKFNFSIEPFNGINLTAGLVYHCRTQVDWNHVAEEHGMLHKYRSFAPRIHLKWIPGSYYYWKGTRKIHQYSNWPTFDLDYERGVKWFDWRNEYERWEFDMQYKLPLYALRALYIRIGAGFYTKQKSLYFLDYDNFSYENLPLGWDDELSGQFHLLDSRWYNESEYYVRFCSAYESPMLLLSRLKFLSNYIQKERLYCNMLAVHALLPYVEFGYGIATHIFDAACFVGGANGTGFSLGTKITLRLFDEW